MDYIDNWYSTIQTLLAVYALIHILYSAYSHNLYTKTNTGCTPDSSIYNLLQVVLIFTGILLFRVTDTKSHLGLCTTVVAGMIIYSLARNIKYYFVIKARIRHARVEYLRTGVKSSLTVPGYTSLNTLMLATLINVVGVFCVGTSVYYSFIGFPVQESMMDYPHEHYGNTNYHFEI